MVLGCYSFLSVSIKDRSLLIPLVMLNISLTFSWHEGDMTGTPRVSPRCVLAVRRSLGTAAPVYSVMFTGIVSLVICSSL
jgi:hypothetical protein